MRHALLMAIACGFILASASAQAVEPWETPFMSTQKQSAMVWKEMRDCARGAAQRAQDHTPEGNKKREETRLNCLRLHHLPVDPQPSRNYSPPS